MDEPLVETPRAPSTTRPRKRSLSEVGVSPKRMAFYIFVNVALSVVSNIISKHQLDAYGTKYVFFLQELRITLYGLFCTFFIVYRIFVTGSITARMRKSFPLWKFAVLGALDATTDELNVIGGVNTPGEWQVLLRQLLIPFIMVISFFWVRTRYDRWQVGGAGLIIAGSLLALFAHQRSSGANHAVWYSVVIYASQNVPAAFSRVFKEVAFKSAHLDIFWLSGLVSWTQIILQWPLLPLQTLPGFGNFDWDVLPETITDGWRCFLGDTTVPVIDATGAVTGYCSSYNTWILFAGSIIDFIGGGIFYLLILKHGSALLTTIASALSLPLSNLAFTIRALNGRATSPFSWYDVGGLIAVLFGFVFYQRTSEEFKEFEEGDDTLEDSGSKARLVPKHDSAATDEEAPTTTSSSYMIIDDDDDL
eukprot:PLAT2833.1.p1 GENE.PLAT2833.1~~PLAT2833.1.p1  ORF type:complete len:420 (+),score=158.05 PLAT2833.1:1048-2307(+)